MKVCGFDLFVTLKLYGRVGPAARDKAGQNGNKSQGFLSPTKIIWDWREGGVAEREHSSRSDSREVTSHQCQQWQRGKRNKRLHYSEITLSTHFDVPLPFPILYWLLLQETWTEIKQSSLSRGKLVWIAEGLRDSTVKWRSHVNCHQTHLAEAFSRLCSMQEGLHF